MTESAARAMHPDGPIIGSGVGVIKNIHATFGFIRAADGTDLFFLPTYVDGPDGTFKSLTQHLAVTFDILDHRRGHRAVNVRRREE